MASEPSHHRRAWIRKLAGTYRIVAVVFLKALPWSRTRIWFLWTMGLSVFFVGVSALNLDDFPIVNSDEAWVMSTPYKLTTQGIFGTDLFAGFFDTEPRTIVMPVHYLLVAMSFKLVGPEAPLA